MRSACCGDVRLVRDEHDRFSLLHVELLERMQDDLAGFRIEVSRRLVGKDERRIVDERPRDRDALHHAARNLVRMMLPECFREMPRRSSAFLGDLFALFFRHIRIDERQGDIAQHRRARKQIECLEDESDLLAADVRELFVGKFRDIFAVEKIFAGRRRVERAEICIRSTCRNRTVP